MDNQVIDQVKYLWNLKLAWRLNLPSSVITWAPLDAMKLGVTNFTKPQKGDANSLSVPTASIVARWHGMGDEEYDQQYPGYDFTANAGYMGN